MLKKFKKPENFVEMLKQVGVSKSAVYFKAKLARIIDKYRNLKKSPLSLSFFNG